MNVEEYRDYCLSLGDDVTEGTPFGAFRAAAAVLVFYVAGHMFSFFDMDRFDVVTLKCDPAQIDSLKEHCDAVGDPYNMSHRHWIGVDPRRADPELLRRLTSDSYMLVKSLHAHRRN